MKVSAVAVAATALVAGAEAKNYLGFNSGATKADRTAKFAADFKAEFETAQNLKNAPGDFNAVRLYTNIQAYSDSDPIQAFGAAVDTKTSILLGVWASGTTTIEKEITALKSAIKTYGTSLTDLVIGVSIGSEDLYRNTATSQKNDGGVGADPDVLVGFIKDFKSAFANTALANIPIGHVDTWDVWPNATNKAVLDAVDWVGVDEYPFYETGKGNSIDNAGKLFDKAYDNTVAAVGGKPIWVTETGWPYTGPDWDEAEASVANAKKYWQDIGCKRLFNQVPTFWYNLRDSNPDNKVKFAITDNLSTTPRFDLTCPEESSTTTTKSSSGSKATGSSSGSKSSDSESSSVSKPTGSSGSSNGTATGSGSSATPTGSSSGSGSSSSGSGSGSGSSSGAASTPTAGTSGASALKMISAAGIAAIVAAIAL